ncbi:NUDIX hydrolase [Microvirga sp. W0021]|uniref:NUDIX hydrolase n=1 Tax=Hohaiivirga grylli TaxID=3133970 RepID=A0ABV0BLQ2_9HYPH
MTKKTARVSTDSFLNFMTKEAKYSPSGNTPRISPRDSASLIILDKSNRSPKVLMGRRSPNQRFMPGKFVFPGGSVEPADRRMPVMGALSSRTERALQTCVSRPSSNRCRALALSAIRETYEETGIMLGSKDYGAPDAPADSIWKKFEEAGVFPDIEQLSFVARAITPPGLLKRFDTRFFIVDRKAIAEEHSGFVGPDEELTELVWVPLKEAEDLDTYMITKTILQELKQRISGGLSELLPIPFYHVKHRKAVRELI